MPWANGGIMTNPATNAVLADTGALPNGGSVSAMLMMSTNVAAIVRYQWRNAANDTTMKEHVFTLGANSNTIIYSPLSNMEFDIGPGDRLRLLLNAGVTGTMCCSIFHPAG